MRRNMRLKLELPLSPVLKIKNLISLRMQNIWEKLKLMPLIKQINVKLWQKQVLVKLQKRLISF